METENPSINEYIKQILPEIYTETTYLSGLLDTFTVPFDVILQVLSYLPYLRDPSYCDKNGLNELAREKNCPRFAGESDEMLANRIKDSFDLWRYSGSRFGLNKALVAFGFSPDATNHEYGIEERVQPDDPTLGLAIWADGDHLKLHKNIVWGHYVWPTRSDGLPEIDTNGLFNLYITDADGSIFSDDIKIAMIINCVKKFGKCTRALYKIRFTDGNGVVLNTKTLLTF